MNRQLKAYDTHHLCFPKAKWCTGYCKAIRCHWYFNVVIPRKTMHMALHREVKEVPTPRGKSAEYALNQVIALEREKRISLDDPVEKRLELLILLFDRHDKPTADAFRKELEIVHRFDQKAPY